MGGPDDKQKQIESLRGELRIISGAISASEGRLKKYQEDYKKYENAIEKLAKIQKDILNGQSFLSKSKTSLSNYASGKKAGMAAGAISSVISMFGSTAGGIDAINTFIETDKQLLNEKYTDEYNNTYEDRIDDYNRTCRKIRELGGSARDKSPTITKKKLG